MVDLVHGDLGHLPEQRNQTVHGGADGSEVVQRNQGVHLELGRAQEALDHGETESLKDDAGDLVDETDPHKLDLADRGDDDTDDNGRDIEEDLEVRLGHAERPAGDEDSNGSGGLFSRVSACPGSRSDSQLWAPTLSIWMKATLR